MYELAIKERVRKLRKEGYTFREIRERLPFLAKGTISEWVRGIVPVSEFLNSDTIKAAVRRNGRSACIGKQRAL